MIATEEGFFSKVAVWKYTIWSIRLKLYAIKVLNSNKSVRPSPNFINDCFNIVTSLSCSMHYIKFDLRMEVLII